MGSTSMLGRRPHAIPSSFGMVCLTVSVGVSVCWSVGRSVCWSVGRTACRTAWQRQQWSLSNRSTRRSLFLSGHALRLSLPLQVFTFTGLDDVKNPLCLSVCLCLCLCASASVIVCASAPVIVSLCLSVRGGPKVQGISGICANAGVHSKARRKRIVEHQGVRVQ